MPEEITDAERTELQAIEKESKKKREITIEEIMQCPTNDCPGGPEIVPVITWKGNDYWKVFCPVCNGWNNIFISKGDPYTEGMKAWEEMRRGEKA